METLNSYLGSTFTTRTENGREYIVAPASLIVPGVLPGNNGPLLYDVDETSKNPSKWDRAPLTLGHPTVNGSNVSAKHPGILESHGLGEVRNTRFNNKLVAEAWFDVEKVARVSPTLLQKLRAGEKIGLSTGLRHRTLNAAPGSKWRDGRTYIGVTKDHIPDHVAVLLNEPGACNMNDGCGINVNAAYTKTKNDVIEDDDEEGMEEECTCNACGNKHSKTKKTNNANPRGCNQYKSCGVGGGGKLMSKEHKDLYDKVYKHASEAVDKYHHSSLWSEEAREITNKVAAIRRNDEFIGDNLHSPNSGHQRSIKNLQEENKAHHELIVRYAEKIMKQSTTNSDPYATTLESTVNRDAIIAELTTNCDCWKGAKDTLQKLTDSQLQSLHNAEVKKGMTTNADPRIEALLKTNELLLKDLEDRTNREKANYITRLTANIKDATVKANKVKELETFSINQLAIIADVVPAPVQSASTTPWYGPEAGTTINAAKESEIKQLREDVLDLPTVNFNVPYTDVTANKGHATKKVTTADSDE